MSKNKNKSNNVQAKLKNEVDAVSSDNSYRNHNTKKESLGPNTNR